MDVEKRTLSIHPSGLNEKEYVLYTRVLDELLELEEAEEDSPTNANSKSEEYYYQATMNVLQTKFWIRGRYAQISSKTTREIFDLFRLEQTHAELLTGGQFFAAFRLVLHTINGEDLVRSLAFAQVTNIDAVRLQSSPSLPTTTQPQGAAPVSISGHLLQRNPPPSIPTNVAQRHDPSFPSSSQQRNTPALPNSYQNAGPSYSPGLESGSVASTLSLLPSSDSSSQDTSSLNPPPAAVSAPANSVLKIPVNKVPSSSPPLASSPIKKRTMQRANASSGKPDITPFESLSHGTTVLAKVKGWPGWPGMIVSPELMPPDLQAEIKQDRPVGKRTKDYVCVRFFPIGDFAWLPPKNVDTLGPKQIATFLSQTKLKPGDDLRVGYEIAGNPSEWVSQHGMQDDSTRKRKREPEIRPPNPSDDDRRAKIKRPEIFIVSQGN